MATDRYKTSAQQQQARAVLLATLAQKNGPDTFELALAILAQRSNPNESTNKRLQQRTRLMEAKLNLFDTSHLFAILTNMITTQNSDLLKDMAQRPSHDTLERALALRQLPASMSEDMQQQVREDLIHALSEEAWRCEKSFKTMMKMQPRVTGTQKLALPQQIATSFTLWQEQQHALSTATTNIQPAASSHCSFWAGEASSAASKQLHMSPVKDAKGYK